MYVCEQSSTSRLSERRSFFVAVAPITRRKPLSTVIIVCRFVVRYSLSLPLFLSQKPIMMSVMKSSPTYCLVDAPNRGCKSKFKCVCELRYDKLVSLYPLLLCMIVIVIVSRKHTLTLIFSPYKTYSASCHTNREVHIPSLLKRKYTCNHNNNKYIQARSTARSVVQNSGIGNHLLPHHSRCFV